MNITIHFIPSQSLRIGIGLLFISLLLSGFFFAQIAHAESSPNADQMETPVESPSPLYQEVGQTPEVTPSPAVTAEFPTDTDTPDEVTPDSVTPPDFNAVAQQTVESTQPDSSVQPDPSAQPEPTLQPSPSIQPDPTTLPDPGMLSDPGALFASPQPDLSSTQ